MFDFAAQSTYQINIRCTDSNGEFREDKLEVDVIPGDRLEFTHSSGQCNTRPECCIDVQMSYIDMM